MNQTHDNVDYECMIGDGIAFLESMNRVYGPDRAHELWLGMKEAMGSDVQMEIFSAMLGGGPGNSIRFRVTRKDTQYAVETIKTIREYTGLGLKEAKDIWDHAKENGSWQQIRYSNRYNPNDGAESVGQFKMRIKNKLRSLDHEVV